jgi:hypothetical protein
MPVAGISGASAGKMARVADLGGSPAWATGDPGTGDPGTRDPGTRDCQRYVRNAHARAGCRMSRMRAHTGPRNRRRRPRAARHGRGGGSPGLSPPVGPRPEDGGCRGSATTPRSGRRIWWPLGLRVRGSPVPHEAGCRLRPSGMYATGISNPHVVLAVCGRQREPASGHRRRHLDEPAERIGQAHLAGRLAGDAHERR